MTIPSTPLTDEAWRGLSASVDSDDELAPLVSLRDLSRRLERANAVLVEALGKAADTLADAEKAFRLFCKFDAARAMSIAEQHTRAVLVEAWKPAPPDTREIDSG